jgi:hypothetical protein
VGAAQPGEPSYVKERFLVRRFGERYRFYHERFGSSAGLFRRRKERR